jgi:D-alanyl-D-alanine carboxypeptidase
MVRTPREEAYEHNYDPNQIIDLPRRRYSSKISKQPQKDFYSDEHPEVPKVRRASLHLDQVSPSHSSVTRSGRPSNPPGTSALAPSTPFLVDEDQETLPPPSTSKHPRAKKPTYNDTPSRPTTRKIPAETNPSTRKISVETRKYSFDEFDDEEMLTAAPSTDKMSVTRSRHTRIYTPPASSRTTRGRGSKALKRYPTTRRRQGITRIRPILLVLAGMALLVVIASFIAPGAFHNVRTTIQTAKNIAGNTVAQKQSGETSANTPNSPANPHQLVIVPPVNNDHPAPPVYATSAYLLDADTGATLYASNPFMHLPMLSTTKLMTALLAAETGNPDQQIKITDPIARDINSLSADSSLMGIKKGETYTLRELLYGLMLVSGNDAAITIADGLDGNLPAFVAKMNQRAQQLGLDDTHYMNPHGLLMQGHYSSAHDLAFLGKYSLSNPLIRQISSTREFRLPKSAAHPEHILVNGNQFLWWYPGVDGGKPGWDGANNFNQVISSVRNKHHLIGVVMHTKDWWTDMRDLMNWGFNTFQWISPAEIDIKSPIPYDADWQFFVRDKKENTIPMANKGRYYIYTGYSISNPILTYFDKSGGLKKFGYPTGLTKVITDTSVKQQFEHASIQCDIQTGQCGTA